MLNHPLLYSRQCDECHIFGRGLAAKNRDWIVCYCCRHFFRRKKSNNEVVYFRSPLLALYPFSNPATAELLAQHVNTSTSYLNYIPLPLLAGSAAPSKQLPIPTFNKYSVDMVSACRQCIVPPPADLQIAIFNEGDTKG